MPSDRQKSGEARREKILQTLSQSAGPITGRSLASEMNVSRQVIVSDINLLKAKNEPILATSQGYLYMPAHPTSRVSRYIVCKHTPEQTEEELMLIVENGGMVKNVVIEHPVYGEMTASLMLHNPTEVKRFIDQLASSESALLSALTDGIHMHEVEAEHTAVLDRIEEALDQAGILYKD
ncbi:transcription repressor NadR [Jeotgalibacillus haloalkalitolerans]|uniref:Transcription repressor NadR n=1 Tax=Jeotgalibacillus haloalkalitolerans TaxID=3104292 RepID=A0ABU5KM52_9BACL|nr:transcription repressor NadR [Jeotgalibacillus sp. HH7-29]MDZ5712343.1 transcription repressor NadR [Jeotgalibacillus sp. HH7-29]